MFAIALLAATAAARSYGHAAPSYGHAAPSYGRGGSSYGHAAPTQSYHAAPVSYGYSGHAAPVQHGSYGQAAPVHAHTTAFKPADVWTEAPVVNTTGWYSETQQYSPPKIAFVPDVHEPTFGICEINVDVAEAGLTDVNLPGTGSIQFAQFPGKPTLYRYNFVSTLAGATDFDAGTTNFRPVINETGIVTASDGGTACD